ASLSVSGQGVLAGTFGKSQVPVCGLQVGGPVQGLASSVQVFTMWFWSHPPLPSQPAVVQASLSVSGQGVLAGTFGKSQLPVCGLQVGGPVQGLASAGQGFTMRFWSHPPLPAQPAVVQELLSVSGQGVRSGTFGKSQFPVCGLQVGGPVQGLASSVQVFTMWFWSPPSPSTTLFRAQASLSVSGQGVLSGTFGKSQFPVCGLQVGGPVQGLVSSVQVFTMWFWSQPSVTLPPVASVPLQPAVVQALLSVSVHGVLSATGVWLHIPVLW